MCAYIYWPVRACGQPTVGFHQLLFGFYRVLIQALNIMTCVRMAVAWARCDQVHITYSCPNARSGACQGLVTPTNQSVKTMLMTVRCGAEWCELSGLANHQNTPYTRCWVACDESQVRCGTDVIHVQGYRPDDLTLQHWDQQVSAASASMQHQHCLCVLS